MKAVEKLLALVGIALKMPRRNMTCLSNINFKMYKDLYKLVHKYGKIYWKLRELMLNLIFVMFTPLSVSNLSGVSEKFESKQLLREMSKFQS